MLFLGYVGLMVCSVYPTLLLKLNRKPLRPRTFHLTYPTHEYQLYAMTEAFLRHVPLHTDPTGAR